jgi:uncharacterized Rmd1/YagE family protein
MQPQILSGETVVVVKAWRLGEHFRLRRADFPDPLALRPLTIPLGESGCAVLFRYGVVVTFGLEPGEEAICLDSLVPYLDGEPSPEPETETVDIVLRPEAEEGVDREGRIVLRELDVERFQVVAEALGKSTVLDHYEKNVQAVFARIAPLAGEMKEEGGGRGKGRELVRHIGGALLMQYEMVGRVEVLDKPDLLWDRQDLDRLYAALEREYELRDRHATLERKLELVSHTARTLLDMFQHKQTLRVEWYIVILIVVEIVILVYEMFFPGTLF